MLSASAAFSSFSVDDVQAARAFYADVLGLGVVVDEEMGGMLRLSLPGGQTVVVYPKDDHVPATFTVLNLVVPDVDAAVDELARSGVVPERYEGFHQDERGVARGVGPAIAWFTDPAGNVLSVLEG